MLKLKFENSKSRCKNNRKPSLPKYCEFSQGKIERMKLCTNDLNT